MKNIKKYIGWCCLAFFPLGACAQITANPFTLQSVSRTSSMNIAQTFRSDGLHTIDFDPALPVYGMALSGHVSFHDAGNSMVRVTAVCDNGTEYLLYETSPLFSDGQDFDIEDGAMETAVLDAETIVKLNVTLLNATLYLSNVKYNRDAVLNASQQKNEVALVQEAGLIARLNENLEKQGHLWRAGKTSLSGMTYEQKKAVFGDPLPYLGGYEYYIGGIFVMPDYVPKKAPVEDSLFVKEWDWRNRHGRNWMTPVKYQGDCNSCYVFAPVGAMEAYINLYYNQSLNYNLSEQQVMDCSDPSRNCSIGGFPNRTFDYLRDGGAIPEDCAPYAEQRMDCSDVCSNPSDRFKIGGYKNITSFIDLKKCLLRAPVCLGYQGCSHVVVAAGYNRIEAGDHIIIASNEYNTFIELTVPVGHPLVGATAWLFKNSAGMGYGQDGYAYVVLDNWQNYCYNYSITGKIKSEKLSDSDIVVSDKDGDGFYFWGIGDRPASLPDWVPMEADGDDSDPAKGPMDAYGNLMPSGRIQNVQTSTTWTSLRACLPIVFVEKGVTLTLKGTMCLNPGSCIFVKDGGSLILDGVTLNRASIKVYTGGRLTVKNGSVLNREEGDILEVDLGGVMEWTEGSMVQQ